MHPTIVEGKLFSNAESDYIYGSDLLNDPQPEVECDTPDDEEILHTSLDEESSNIRTSTIKNKKPKFYPNESLQHMKQPNYFEHDDAPLQGPFGQKHILEPDQPQAPLYNMATVANVRIEANQMKMVDIAIADRNGLLAASDYAYKAKGGLITPGVVVLDAIVNSTCTVAVLNFNSEFINLQKGIPLTSAEQIAEDIEIMEVDSLTDKGVPLHKPEVYSLLTLTSMTEEAYVTNAEMDSEPDTLQNAMEYNPAELSTEPVVYDEHRFRKLLKLLNADTWKLSREQRRKMENILFHNQRAFNLPREPLPKTHLIEHDIELTDDEVVFVKPRWTPVHQRPHIETEVNAWLDQGLAKPTMSPYNSPVVLVRKKEGNKTGSYRIAVDYRSLNKKTVPLYFPCNNIDEVVLKISQSKCFSKIDLRSAFNQIGMTLRASLRSAFSCHLGHIRHLRLPFGLINGPHTMNHLMTMVFGSMSEYISFFFDDIFIHSQSVDDHLQHIEAGLGKLIWANLQVSPEKSLFFSKEVSVLGHIAGQGFIKPGLDKKSAIQNFPIPISKTNVRSFLGLTGFYRKFISRYACIAKPLTLLTRDDVEFNWGPDQQRAFQTLKDHLLKEPILRAPDFSRCWYIVTDACDIGIGAWLGQRYEGFLHPVAYFSRQLRKNELGLKRDAMDLETLSILESLKKFRPLIWGQKIVVMSDNSALQWLFSKSTYKSARLTRWALAIAGFNVDILHYPGSMNRVADSLSRNPVPIQMDDDMEAKAQTIVEACDDQGISLIGLYSKQILPSQKEILLRINGIRNQQKDVEETDLQQAWTIEELERKQNSDVLLKPIIEYLKNPSEMNKKKIDPNIKTIDSYFLDSNKILFIKINDPKAELRTDEEVLVIPHSLQTLATSIIHDTVLGGHMASERTIFAAKRRFYWRHMDTFIKKYVNKCKVCMLHKGRSHPKQPLRRYPVPDKFFDVVSTDLIGPLPLTSSGNKYILVVTDFLSRYTTIKPLPNKSADTTAEGLWSIFCEHGTPSILYSDSGCEFRNGVLKEMAKNFKFSHIRVAVYHPSSNGLCERKNASILSALKCFLDLDEWDKCLPTAQLAVNSAYTSALGDSPFFIYKGKDPELPATRFAKPKFSYADSSNFEQGRQKREHFVMESVKEKLLEAADRNCRQRAKHCKEKTLQVEDRVFIRRIQKKNESKLIPKWQGPYRILSQKNPGVYKLKDLKTGKVSEVHIENIKERVIMARESEIPLIECPEARLPFPKEENILTGNLGQDKRIPEGAADDNWIDVSHVLETSENVNNNVLENLPDKNYSENNLKEKVYNPNTIQSSPKVRRSERIRNSNKA